LYRVRGKETQEEKGPAGVEQALSFIGEDPVLLFFNGLKVEERLVPAQDVHSVAFSLPYI
jgi:hypothetical protein